MQLHQVYLVVLALIPGTSTTCSCCGETSDILSFSKNMSDEDFVRRGEYVEIFCCARNFIGNVKWSQYRDGALEEFPPPDDKESYIFNHRGQQLIIKEARMRDNGTFICTAKNGAKSVAFNMHLNVLECPTISSKVLPLRMPNPTQYTSVGKTLVLMCLGDFGCGLRILRRVIWMVKSSQHTEHLEGDNPYYSIKKINNSNGTILGQELTFKEVTPDNFTAYYVCILSDGHDDPRVTVVLERERTTQKFPIWAIALLSILGGVVLIAVLVMAVKCTWGYQLQYWCKSTFNIGWPKDCDDKKIGLVSSEESRVFVSRHIYEPLRLDYRDNIYYNHESPVNDGQAEASANLEELQRCSHVILFLTEEEERETFSRFFVEIVPKIRSASKVIIIHKGNLKNILKSFEDDTSDSLKLVKNFEYPEHNNDNSRIMKNFWCSVKLCLPAIQDTPGEETSANVTRYRQTPQRHSSSSSSSALLQDET